MTVTLEERTEMRDFCAMILRGGKPPNLDIRRFPALVEKALDSLEAVEAELDAMRQQLYDLMSESQGVAGLHLNGDLAEWDWLIENEWLSLWATQETPRGEGKYAGRLPHDVAGWNPNDEGHG